MVFLPDAPIGGDRRSQLKSLRGSSWRNSWRNSSRTLDSRDGVKAENVSSVPPSNKKTVRFPFEESSLVAEIAPLENTMAAEDIPTMWYQSEDYIKFEKDCALTSYAYLASRRGRGSPFDSEKYSVRGLESHTDERFGKKASVGEKEALSKALKAEEERQKAENIFPDMDKLRKVSVRHTKGSLTRALALAQLDAKDARENNHDVPLHLQQRLRARR